MKTKNNKKERKITREQDIDKSYQHSFKSSNKHREIKRIDNFFCKSFFESFLFL